MLLLENAASIPVEELVRNIEKLLKENTEVKSLYVCQYEALHRVFKEFLRKKRVRGIIQMPTGSGKTILAAAIIIGILNYYERINNNTKILVLFLTPRIVIKTQAHERFKNIVGKIVKKARILEASSSIELCSEVKKFLGAIKHKSIEIYLGKLRHLQSTDNPNILIIITTPQLLNNIFRTNKDCLKLLTNNIEILIVDEAHTVYIGKTTSKTMREFVKSGIPFVIGLTATPIYESRKLFGEILYNKLSRELMDGKVLAKTLRIISYRTTIWNLYPKNKTSVVIKNDPWQYAIYERAEKYSEIIIKILEKIKNKYLDGRMPKTLILAPNVREANMFYKILGAKLKGVVVYKAHYQASRAHKQIESFKKARTAILITVNMADIGFDDPELEVLVLARPIVNPVAYTQLRGRVLRKPVSKDNLKNVYGAIIVDLVGYESKDKLEKLVSKVEQGLINKMYFENAVKELKGLNVTPEARAKVKVKYVREYRVGIEEEQELEGKIDNIVDKLLKRFQIEFTKEYIILWKVNKYTKDELYSINLRQFIKTYGLSRRHVKKDILSDLREKLKKEILKELKQYSNILFTEKVSRVVVARISDELITKVENYINSYAYSEKYGAIFLIASYVEKILAGESSSFNYKGRIVNLTLERRGHKRYIIVKVGVSGRKKKARIKIIFPIEKTINKLINVLNNLVR